MSITKGRERMRVSKAMTRLLSAVVVVVAAGCSWIAPSEPEGIYYEVGLAWVGDVLYLVAPMCSTDSLSRVVIVDSGAMSSASGDVSWEDTMFDMWRVSHPVAGSDADSGLIAVGDSSSFSVVESEFDGVFPAEIETQFWFDVDGGTHSVGGLAVPEAVFVPTYPVGTDLMSIDFYWGSSRGGGDLASFDEMNDGTCVTAYRF